MRGDLLQSLPLRLDAALRLIYTPLQKPRHLSTGVWRGFTPRYKSHLSTVCGAGKLRVDALVSYDR